MLEPACEVFFFKDDLKDIERKGYGVVFSTSASNHYCPTIVISKKHYANWQLEQVALLSKAQLALIQENDINDVSDVNAVHIEVLKEQLNYTIKLFGPTINTGASATRAKAKARVPGVLFTNAPRIPHQTPESSVGQPCPTPPVPAAPTPQPSPGKKKKGKLTCVNNAQNISTKKQILMTICPENTKWVKI